MKVELHEYHHVTLIRKFNVFKEDIEDSEFDTEEQLKEALMNEDHPLHGEASDMMDYIGYEDSEEDWVTDRKGGFDIEWRVVDGD